MSTRLDFIKTGASIAALPLRTHAGADAHALIAGKGVAALQRHALLRSHEPVENAINLRRHTDRRTERYLAALSEG